LSSIDLRGVTAPAQLSTQSTVSCRHTGWIRRLTSRLRGVLSGWYSCGPS